MVWANSCGFVKFVSWLRRGNVLDRQNPAVARIQRFRSGVKNSHVIEVHNTCHYVFIVDEALVVREMRKFLLDE